MRPPRIRVAALAAALAIAVAGPATSVPVGSATHLAVDPGFVQTWLLPGPDVVPAPPEAPEAPEAPDTPEVDLGACGDLDQYDAITYGTEGPDEMVGANGPQILVGLGGDDLLRGGSQHDCLLGGDGNDQLFGEYGKDTLVGGAGQDRLDGGNGQDALYGDGGRRRGVLRARGRRAGRRVRPGAGRGRGPVGEARGAIDAGVALSGRGDLCARAPGGPVDPHAGPQRAAGSHACRPDGLGGARA